MTLGLVTPNSPPIPAITPPEGVTDAEDVLQQAWSPGATPIVPGLGLGEMAQPTTGMSEADRERVFKYRAKPYLDQAEKGRKDLEQYYESQGLRFSDERREKIGDMTRDIYAQMAESVMVPQIEREQGLGLEAERLKIERERMEKDAGQWAAQFGLESQKFTEAVRQYDTATDIEKDQFAASMGLSRAELDQRILEFNSSFGLQAQQVRNQADQFAASLGLDTAKFAEAQRQYKTSTDIQKDQFAQSLGLSRAELDQRMLEFDRTIALQETQIRNQAEQFAASLGLDERKFAEARRQYDTASEIEKDQFAQSLGLSRAELEQRISEFDQEYLLRKEQIKIQEKQFAESLGLDRDKFAEARRQFEVGTQFEQEKLAQQMGLSWAELDQRVKEFDQDIAYRDKALAFEKQKFTEITNQWAQEFGMDGQKFAEAKRQFDVGDTREQERLAAEMGISWEELRLRVSEFDQEMDYRDRALSHEVTKFQELTSQWAQEFGLDEQKFKEAARQFDTATEEGRAQFAAQMGMSQAELKATIDQFNSKMELAWDQFDLDEIIARAEATGWWEDTTETLAALLVNFQTSGVDYGGASPVGPNGEIWNPDTKTWGPPTGGGTPPPGGGTPPAGPAPDFRTAAQAAGWTSAEMNEVEDAWASGGMDAWQAAMDRIGAIHAAAGDPPIDQGGDEPPADEPPADVPPEPPPSGQWSETGGVKSLTSAGQIALLNGDWDDPALLEMLESGNYDGWDANAKNKLAAARVKYFATPPAVVPPPGPPPDNILTLGYMNVAGLELEWGNINTLLNEMGVYHLEPVIYKLRQKDKITQAEADQISAAGIIIKDISSYIQG